VGLPKSEQLSLFVLSSFVICLLTVDWLFFMVSIYVIFSITNNASVHRWIRLEKTFEKWHDHFVHE
jgi:uncharacterized membrane protein